MAEEIKAILENDEKLTEVTKAVFDAVDTDGSGRIDYGELRTAIVSVTTQAEIPVPSDEQIEEAFNKLDKDRSGNIDVHEFKDLVKQLLQAIVDN